MFEQIHCVQPSFMPFKAILLPDMNNFTFPFFHHTIMKWHWLSPYFKHSVFSCWLLCVNWKYSKIQHFLFNTQYKVYWDPGKGKVIADSDTTTILQLSFAINRAWIWFHFQKYWKTKLSQKFRNEKKRHHKNNELAQPKKRIKPAGSSTNANKNAHSNMWGVKHYLPDRPDGEDNATIARHQEAMKSESKKLRQDLAKVRLLMDLTFADRRKRIVTDLCRIKDLQLEYPCLFHEDEVSLLNGETMYYQG